MMGKYVTIKSFIATTLAVSLLWSSTLMGMAPSAQAEPFNAFLDRSPLVMTHDEFINWYQAEQQEKGMQPVSFNGEQPLTAGIERNSYTLGVGDVISILVQGYPEFSREGIAISTDGVVTLPYIGEVTVLDQHRDELESDLTDRVREYIVDPKVDVIINRRRPPLTYVLGSVMKPGAYLQLPIDANLPDTKGVYANTNFNLSLALANAGGITEMADLKNIHIINEKQGTHRVANLFDLLVMGKSDQDLTLSPNDVVYVPRLEVPMDPQTLKVVANSVVGQDKFKVRVHGLVKSANIYELAPDQMTMQSAISMAGGVLPEANTRKVIIARTMPDGSLKKIETDLYDQDVMLHPNDIVMVADPNLAHKFNGLMLLTMRALGAPLQASFIFRNMVQSFDQIGIIKDASAHEN